MNTETETRNIPASQRSDEVLAVIAAQNLNIKFQYELRTHSDACVCTVMFFDYDNTVLVLRIEPIYAKRRHTGRYLAVIKSDYSGYYKEEVRQRTLEKPLDTTKIANTMITTAKRIGAGSLTVKTAIETIKKIFTEQFGFNVVNNECVKTNISNHYHEITVPALPNIKIVMFVERRRFDTDTYEEIIHVDYYYTNDPYHGRQEILNAKVQEFEIDTYPLVMSVERMLSKELKLYQETNQREQNRAASAKLLQQIKNPLNGLYFGLSDQGTNLIKCEFSRHCTIEEAEQIASFFSKLFANNPN